MIKYKCSYNCSLFTLKCWSQRENQNDYISSVVLSELGTFFSLLFLIVNQLTKTRKSTKNASVSLKNNKHLFNHFALLNKREISLKKKKNISLKQLIPINKELFYLFVHVTFNCKC